MTLPYVVVRSNNLTLCNLDALTQSAEVFEIMKHLKTVVIDEQAARETLIASLYQMAGDQHPEYRLWLSIKAKLSQGKIDQDFITRHGQAITRVDGGLCWLEVWHKLVAVSTTYQQIFDRAINKSRRAIVNLVQQESFQKSISFTRGNISGIVRRYCNHQGNYNKSFLNEEDTILCYLTRAITKVSPFSGFTSVGFSKVDEMGGDKLVRHAGVEDRYSVDRSVFQKIYDQLVLTQRTYWNYCFSSNLYKVGDQAYCYSLGDNRSIYPFRSSLVKSRIPNLPIDMQQFYTFDELCNLLGPTFPAKFGPLIINGILQFDPKLDDQSPDIIQDFKDKIQLLKLRGFNFPAFEEQLEKIHREFLQLPEIPVNHISLSVDNLTTHIHALGELVGYRLIKQTGIIYHDSMHPVIEGIRRPVVDKFAMQVSEFMAHYIGINYDSGISASLMHSLRNAMLPGQNYNLFEFYDLASAQLRQGTADPRKNVGKLSKLLAFYDYLWQHKDTDLLQLPDVAPSVQEHTMSAYGHVDGERFILNCVDGGYLRVWSRFFTFNEDSKVLDACVDAYEDSLKEAYDFYDTFGFNTGRRPRLAQRRIWLDRARDCKPEDLTLETLYVKWLAGDSRPRLYNSQDHKEVTLRHTALFVPQLYPKLLEILIRFSMMEKQSYFAPRFGIYDMVVQNTQLPCVKLPRVVYKDIVVSRRQWWLDKSLIPVKNASESLPDYLLRLNQWRNELSMPAKVFIRRHAKDKVLQRDTSNNKKPLFVDFLAPIMCRPLSRWLNSAYDYISFEEMLPDASDDFMQSGGQRYASEIIFEKIA